MTPTQAINFFGTQAAVAKTLEISQPAVSQMTSRVRIPKFQQIELAAASLGYLETDAEIMDRLYTQGNTEVN